MELTKAQIQRCGMIRGVIGLPRSLELVAPKLPDRTPIYTSGYVPRDMIYVINDPELAAFLEHFAGLQRAR